MALILLTSTLIVLGGVGYITWRNKQTDALVRKESQRLKKVNEWNQTYGPFDKVNRKYTFKVSTQSKKRFKRFDFKRYLGGLLQDNSFKAAYHSAHSNAERWPAYIKQAEAILADNSLDSGQGRTFIKRERRLCKRALFNKPRMSFKTVIKLGYVSKSGRDTDEMIRIYAFKNVTTVYEEITHNAEEKKQAKRFAQQQRALVTSSVRYEILKRDGFTCVLCGRTADEGVKLHVDHIKPVAKGGMSTEDNPRSLCADCNMGKSDKYDPDGLN